MNNRYFHTAAGRSLVGRMLLAMMLLMLGITVVPHHHHGGEDVCLRMDVLRHQAEPTHAAAQCDACCITRTVYCGQRDERAVVKPVFLLSFFFSSVLLGMVRFRVPQRKPAWSVRRRVVVPDEYCLHLFGWRAPPFS